MSEGTIAWLLISSALVLFMTPGLALFYGGMVRSKNVLNMLMKNFFTISIVTVIWTVIGYTLAFGTDLGGFIGGFDFLGLKGVEGDALLFMVFQMMFAIITPALITGAVAERMKFSAWVLVHDALGVDRLPDRRPLGICGRWLAVSPGECATSPGGWSCTSMPASLRWPWSSRSDPERVRGRSDEAPFAAVDPDRHRHPLVRMVRIQCRLGAGRRRHRYQRLRDDSDRGRGCRPWLGGGRVDEDRQADNPRCSLGSGGRPGCDHAGGRFCLTDVGHRDRPNRGLRLLLGGEPQVPSSATTTPSTWSACTSPVASSDRCCIGVFAQSSINEFVPDGLLFGGGAFFIKQVVAVLAVMAFTFIVSYLLARIVKAITGLRVDEQEETEGLDISLHEERGYVLSE